MRIIMVLFIFSCWLSLVSQSFGESTRLIAFYVAPWVEKAPDIDGNLNESQWRKAHTAEDYYEFAKMNPDRSSLKTELKIIWCPEGIAVGIVNYERNPEKLRAKISLFDSGDLWRDDCAELYFDPKGNCVGFFKFMINSLGVRSDMRRIDAAISLPNWSGSGWRAATKVFDDKWIIEAFFPWSDFDTQAEPGDLWRFEHARFAYTTGVFQGAVWAPEGMYARPQGFGYLYFSKKVLPTPCDVGKMLSEKVVPPWIVSYGKKVISCDKADEYQCDSFAMLKRKTSESIRETIKKVEAIAEDSKELSKIEKSRSRDRQKQATPQALEKFRLSIRQVGFRFAQLNILTPPMMAILKTETEALLADDTLDFPQLRRLQKYNSDLTKMLWQWRLNNFVNNLK